MAKTVVARWKELAGSQPEAWACCCLNRDLEERERFTYGDLQQRAISLMESWQARLGELAGKRVVVLVPSLGVEHLAVILGAWLGGAVPVLLPEAIDPEVFQRVVKDCRPHLVWRMRSGQSEIEYLEGSDDMAEDLALLMYTSGSTKLPRGVMVSHANLAFALDYWGKNVGLQRGVPCVNWMPLYHNVGFVLGWMFPLLNGCPVAMLSPEQVAVQPRLWLQAISRYRAQFSLGTDSMYAHCARSCDDEAVRALDLSGWRWAINGAEPVRSSTLSSFGERFKPAGFAENAWCPSWGMSECVSLLVQGSGRTNSWRNALWKPESAGATDSETYHKPGALRLGKGIAGESTWLDAVAELVCCGEYHGPGCLQILDGCGNVCPEDTVGELCLQSPAVASGYWGQAEESARVFSPQGLRSGDLGFLHAGCLYLCGRNKDVVKINGRLAYPLDLEQVLERALPVLAGHHLTVCSAESAGAERLLVLWEGETGAWEDLRTRVSEVLWQKVRLAPDFVAEVAAGSLPRTANGKIRRAACAESWRRQTLVLEHGWSGSCEADVVVKLVSHGQVIEGAVASLASESDILAEKCGTTVSLRPSNEEQVLDAIQHWAQEQGISGFDPDRRFSEYGLGSLKMGELLQVVAEQVGVALPLSVPWSFPTPRLLAQETERLRNNSRSVVSSVSVNPVAVATENERAEPLAIVGIGCRFPAGVNTPQALWEFLGSDCSAVAPMSYRRRQMLWEPDLADELPGQWEEYRAAFLTGIERFEGRPYHLTPAEIPSLDPQQRLLLQVAEEAFREAGWDLSTLPRKRTGVFVGAPAGSFRPLLYKNGYIDAWHSSGTLDSALAGRLAFAFDLGGPALVTDTACSSSLTALHVAAEELRQKRCDLALVGGVRLYLSRPLFRHYRELNMLAPDGMTKALSAQADGYGRGEGCVVLALQRLTEALQSGRHIWAVVRGTALNQDGGSNGFTAPKGSAQSALLREALSRAGVSADDLSYLELHGTGTPLGDPIELAAVGELVKERQGVALRVGSVKSRVGHLEGAAGLAGVLQTALALHYRTLPAHRLHGEPTDKFAWKNLQIQRIRESWQGERLLAGVSSFGLTGSNAEAILQDAPSAAQTWNEQGGLGLSGESITAAVNWTEQSATSNWIETFKAVQRAENSTAIQRTENSFIAEPKSASVQSSQASLAPDPDSTPADRQPLWFPLHGLPEHFHSLEWQDIAVPSADETVAGRKDLAICLPAETEAAWFSAAELGAELSGLGTLTKSVRQGDWVASWAGCLDETHPLLYVAGGKGPRQELEEFLTVVSLLAASNKRVYLHLLVSEGIVAHAALVAALRAVRGEYPNWKVSSLAVDRLSDASELLPWLQGNLQEDELRRSGASWQAARLRTRAIDVYGERVPVEKPATALALCRSRLESSSEKRAKFAAPLTYLISGGTGGLGLALAEFMAERGARHLVLASRQAAEADCARYEALSKWGAEVRLVTLDVSVAADVEALIAEIQASEHPLGGVFHLAGAYHPQLVAGLQADDWRSMWDSKAEGALNLHRATAALKDIEFVVYSSVASLLTAPGQALYAAANACAEAVVRERRSRGGKGQALCWCTCNDVGLMAGDAERLRQLSLDGVGQMGVCQALNLLEVALEAQIERVILGTIAAERWLDYYPQWRGSSLWREAEANLVAAGNLGALQPGAVGSSAVRELSSVATGHSCLPASEPQRASSGAPTVSLREVAELAAQVLGQVHSVSALVDDAERPFREWGLDSLHSVELRGLLQKRLGLALPITALFEHPNLADLHRYIARELRGKDLHQPKQSENVGQDTSSEQGTSTRQDIQSEQDTPTGQDTSLERCYYTDAVAIIGIGCRLPGGIEGPSAFWEALVAGRDLVNYPGPERARETVSARRLPGGYLEDIAGFDADFFGISGAEADSMAPQQRILLETAQQALEDAGLAPQSTAGWPVGVFVGMSSNEYGDVVHAQDAFTSWSGTGVQASAVAGRLAYAWGWSAPALVVDTACSSSLVAVHLACQSLRQGECQLAVAAGVNLIIDDKFDNLLTKLGAISPSGRCRSYSAQADGFVRGEGCGVVVLKPLAQARRDGDAVYAVIAGSAVNQDGRSHGFSAPSLEAQKGVITQALRQAGWAPRTVAYVEGHGTATPLGDPLELRALQLAYGIDRAEPLRVGTVKSNLGHLEGASGLIGLVKAALCLQKGELVPSLHGDAPTPHCDWSGLKLSVRAEAWPSVDPRRAGVSAFGLAGTNAHVVLESVDAPAGREEHSMWRAPRLFNRTRHWFATGDGIYGDVVSCGKDSAIGGEGIVVGGKEPAVCGEELAAGGNASCGKESAVGGKGLADDGVISANLGQAQVYHLGWLAEETASTCNLAGQRLLLVGGGPRRHAWAVALGNRGAEVQERDFPGAADIDAQSEQWGSDFDQIVVLALDEGERALESLFPLWQGWSRCDLAPAARVVVFTQGVYGVRGTSEARSAQAESVSASIAARLTAVRNQASQARLWGLLRTFMYERPDCSWRLVDLPEGEDDALCSCVLQELVQQVSEAQVRWQEGQRFVARVVAGADGNAACREAVDADPQPGLPADDIDGAQARDGVVLVSGAGGALAAHLLPWLVQRGYSRLVLWFHNPLNAEQMRTVASLRQAGATAEVLVVPEAGAMWAELERSAVKLDLICHLAGCLDDGLIADLTLERIQRVVAPKADLLRDMPVSFWEQRPRLVLFSALASEFGSAGQGAYAAANAYLDGWAQALAGDGYPCLAVNWGPWTVGLGVGRDARVRRRLANLGLRYMNPQDALDVLGQLWEKRGRYTVAALDWTQYRMWWPPVVAPFFAEIERGGLQGNVVNTIASVGFVNSEGFVQLDNGTHPDGTAHPDSAVCPDRTTHPDGTAHPDSAVCPDRITHSDCAAYPDCTACPDRTIHSDCTAHPDCATQPDRFSSTAHHSQSGRVASSACASLREAVLLDTARLLGLPTSAVAWDLSFNEQGFDSLMAVELRNLLSQRLGRPLSATVAFDYPTPQALLAYLEGVEGDGNAPKASAEQRNRWGNVKRNHVEPRVPCASVYSLPRSVAGECREGIAEPSEGIAIVGMSCRLPGGVDSPQQLWQLLWEHRDPLDDVPLSRWDVEAHGSDSSGYISSRQGGFLKDIDLFDAGFFAISPREAKTLDPQQRLVLEGVWRALEDAQIAPSSLAGTRTAVYMGLCTTDYGNLVRQQGGREPWAVTGVYGNALSGRVAYLLGLEGPALTVDTACSSSLVAVHLACRSLLAGECDTAIVGGVNLILDPATSELMTSLQALSPTSRCRVFSQDADGYVRSEGCGILILQRYSEAQREHRPIWARIAASALGQDGRSNGFTAPRGPAQEDVMRRALALANLTPQQISLIETHGVGTPLSDPMELQSVQAVYGQRGDRGQLYLGAVKSNLGHTEAAAGVTAIIKSVLCLRHGAIPANLHCSQPTDLVDWRELGLALPLENTLWPNEGMVRRAGVNGFGISGTNAHIILEYTINNDTNPCSVADQGVTDNSRLSHIDEIGYTDEHGDEQPSQSGRTQESQSGVAIVLSAKSASALYEQMKQWQGRAKVAPSVGDVVSTVPADASMSAGASVPENITLAAAADVANRRDLFPYAVAVWGRTWSELDELWRLGVEQQVLSAGADSWPAGLWACSPGEEGVDAGAESHAPAVLFTGQGSQYAGMGREIYAFEPSFREAWERCAVLAQPFLPVSLSEVVWGEGAWLNRAECAQLALFSLEYSLYCTWAKWGLRPRVVFGHSLGEFVAACVAGVFCLEDAIRLVAKRGQLMGALPAGAMVAIWASEKKVRERLGERELFIAAINSPMNCAVSGSSELVEELCEELTRDKVHFTRLPIVSAGHSPLLRPMLGEFAEVARSVRYQVPQLPIVSGMTGKLAGPEIAASSYWEEHLMATVRFSAGMRTLAKMAVGTYLEIGAQPALSAMGAVCLLGGRELFLPSLRPGRPELETMSQSWARLRVQGAVSAAPRFLAWQRVARSADLRLLPEVPGYAWERRSYWFDSSLAPSVVDSQAQPARKARPAARAAAALDYPADVFMRVEWQLIAASDAVIADSASSSAARLYALTLDGESSACPAIWEEMAWAGQGDSWASERWLTLDEWEALFAQESAAARIVCWAGGCPGGDEAREAERLCAAFLRLAQVLARTERSVRLFVLTTGAHAPSGYEAIRPSQSAVCSLARAAATEYPTWRTVCLDNAEDAPQFWSIVRALVQEAGCAALSAEDELCVSAEGAWAPRLVYAGAGVAAESVPPLDERGVYLISGGTGGLGSALAQWLLERGAGQVVLISRQGGWGKHLSAVAAQYGERLQSVRADVAQFEQIKQAIAPFRSRVRGIFHLAGRADLGLLVEQNAVRLQGLMQPKAQGAWNLHNLSLDLNLDYFVLYSSVGSLLPSPGQTTYAAANGFLDGVASLRRSLGLPVTCVSWSLFTDRGMGCDDGRDLQRLLASGLGPLVTEFGCQCLGRLMVSGCTQTAVLPLHVGRWLEYCPAWSGRSLLEALAPRAERAAVQKRTHTWQELDAEGLRESIGMEVRRATAHCLGIDDPQAVADGRPFRDMGLDSLMAVELRGALEQASGLPLPITLVFDCPTVRQLTDYLTERWQATFADTRVERRSLGENPGDTSGPSALDVNADKQVRVTPAGDYRPQDIAIVGWACHYPGEADDCEEYWQLLLEGRDCIGELPAGRFNMDDWYDPRPGIEGKTYCRRGGFIDVSGLDAGFFGISPLEAQTMDPHQLLLLQTVWEALENAGRAPLSMAGSDTGVYVGLGNLDYSSFVADWKNIDSWTGTGLMPSVVAGRVSFVFGLQGPAVVIDTACSSSLVAVHLACQALKAGECEQALACGVNLVLSPYGFVFHARLGGLAHDGRCKSFDASADGLSRSDGCGVLLLKTVERAQRDGDRILAIIRGSAVNQDGRSNGLTAPNAGAQRLVMQKALKQAGIASAQVGFVEGHGTGTPLGDPIELQALGAVYGERRHPLWVGSAKSNIGHCEGASGVAALIKGALILNHGMVPRNLHFNVPTPHVNWQQLGLAVPTANVEMPDMEFVGVSNFGISGTNGHVILQKYSV